MPKKFHVGNSGIRACRLGAELHGMSLLVENDAASGSYKDRMQYLFQTHVTLHFPLLFSHHLLPHPKCLVSQNMRTFRKGKRTLGTTLKYHSCTFSMLLRGKILLNSKQPMILLDIINHPGEMVIIFSLVSCIITATE